MMDDPSDGAVLVSLPKSLVGALLQIQESFDAGFVDVLKNAINVSVGQQTCSKSRRNEAPSAEPPGRKHAAEFLGTRLTAWTLPEVFAQFVDLTAEVAPEALDKLEAMRGRTRRFVARSAELVHAGRRDLPVMRTLSGWWISRNVGHEDLRRALRALARATGLNYGKDVKFPL